MFEKEAYKWTEQNISVGISMYNPSIEMYCGKAFKDGAELAYNSANEWHYVKDGDLPNTEFGRADVTVAYINAYENPCKRDCCFDGINFVYWDARKPIGWKKVDIFGKIYAWKYQEKLPEIPKESE